VTLGRPRLHLRETTSTNDRARDLATRGAPHGTAVTAGVQTAGRGRYGRTWSAPAGSSILLSLIVREFDDLLPLRAGLAVADLAGPRARVKWPNDVWIDGLKVAGILVEARPAEGWAVVGIGVNVALDVRDLPPELHGTAGTLGRTRGELDAALGELLDGLTTWLAAPVDEVVEALRARDALLDRPIAWTGGDGVGAGIDAGGGLLVRLADGSTRVLESGEVQLG
jgi:BirA family transcriptional regulator, biotin operon repressor / biotin---[acetyl-CoA-carboxylase] ligase